jgi:predicted ArsR family transcriptional regulator
MSPAIDLLPEARKSLLVALKQEGWATIPRLAELLSISTEAVRQQLSVLEKEGWVVSDCGPDEDEIEARRRGRPPAEYCLSPRGDDLFPKQYSDLAIAFFDALDDPVETLTAFTDKRVTALSESVTTASLAKRVDGLRSIYAADDPFTDVETSEHGYRLVEKNCPFLSFAAERPLFCSTTVSTLRRLTGHEVVREKRFQDGDGRCVFHIYADAPVTGRREELRFEKEPEKNSRPSLSKKPRQ